MTFDASSEARNSTLLATSSGRLSRCRSSSRACAASPPGCCSDPGEHGRRRRRAGRDRVGPDAVRPVLHGHGLHQVDHAGLRRAVGAESVVAADPGARRHADDRPAPLFDHVGQDGPRRVEDGVEGHPLLEPPVVVADVGDQPRPRDADAVVEHVDAPEALDRRRDPRRRRTPDRTRRRPTPRPPCPPARSSSATASSAGPSTSTR